MALPAVQGVKALCIGLGWCQLGVMVVGEEVSVPGNTAAVGVCPGTSQDFLTQQVLVCARKCQHSQVWALKQGRLCLT